MVVTLTGTWIACTDFCTIVWLAKLPGEKDRANTWLARALVGTMRISAEIREILTVQRPVTPQRAGASSSKINDDSVSTFKQACSGRYSGSLKLSSRRFERAHNRSAPLLSFLLCHILCTVDKF